MTIYINMIYKYLELDILIIKTIILPQIIASPKLKLIITKIYPKKIIPYFLIHKKIIKL